MAHNELIPIMLNGAVVYPNDIADKDDSLSARIRVLVSGGPLWKDLYCNRDSLFYMGGTKFLLVKYQSNELIEYSVVFKKPIDENAVYTRVAANTYLVVVHWSVRDKTIKKLKKTDKVFYDRGKGIWTESKGNG